ncbi:MAG: hypothetical protein R3B96_24985 [Pirellulaceae bacterium]
MKRGSSSLAHQADETSRALEVSQERLEQALTATNDILLDWNLQTDAVYLSPQWQEQFGDDLPHPASLTQLRELIEPTDLANFNVRWTTTCAD